MKLPKDNFETAIFAAEIESGLKPITCSKPTSAKKSRNEEFNEKGQELNSSKYGKKNQSIE